MLRAMTLCVCLGIAIAYGGKTGEKKRKKKMKIEAQLSKRHGDENRFLE